MFGWQKIKLKKHYLNAPNTTDFHNFLNFIGQKGLSVELLKWEKEAAKAIPGEVCFYDYDAKYKVSPMEDGLLFEVKYKKGTKYGTGPVVLYKDEEKFTSKVNWTK